MSKADERAAARASFRQKVMQLRQEIVDSRKKEGDWELEQKMKRESSRSPSPSSKSRRPVPTMRRQLIVDGMCGDVKQWLDSRRRKNTALDFSSVEPNPEESVTSLTELPLERTLGQPA